VIFWVLVLWAAPGPAASVARYEALALHALPHDTAAFTQGLVYHDGHLYESTGLYGESTLRKVEPGSGRVIKRAALPDGLFGEGLALLDGRLIQLTWKAGRALVYRETEGGFERLEAEGFDYPTQGWGLTHDGRRLILSDGTSRLRFLDPETGEQRGSVQVRLNGRPVRLLNELEYVDGRVLANVWRSDLILVIDPADGQVTAVVDVDRAALLDPAEMPDPADQADLNGIAWDPEGERLFITGKRWPKVFEIELRRADDW
jgi:glutamine cyclotransferase